LFLKQEKSEMDDLKKQTLVLKAFENMSANNKFFCAFPVSIFYEYGLIKVIKKFVQSDFNQ